MGNRFGKFDCHEAAAADLVFRGFERKADGLGERFVKPSTDAFGAPMTAIVKIIEQRVDPIYGQPNYYQHEFI